MANPKRKTSKARRDKRRTFWRLTIPTFSKCSHCGEVKLPHHICLNCGYYGERKVLEVKARA